MTDKKDKIIGRTVKSVLEYSGVSRLDASMALGLSSAQALTNKYGRDSFSAQDLLAVAECAGLQLAFVDQSGKVAVAFSQRKK